MTKRRGIKSGVTKINGYNFYQIVFLHYFYGMKTR